jgi:prevent-host-death family protein
MITGAMTVSATEFKAKCLQFMEKVKQTHEPILITKRGEVIAQLAPPPAGREKPWLRLRGSVKIKGDIVAPILSERELRRHLARSGQQIRGLFD